MKGMKYQDKLERIRALEAELSFADPTRAAKLTRELVRLKAEVFRGSWLPAVCCFPSAVMAAS